MTAQEYQQKALAYLAKQSTQIIDYEWEIKHHRQMHEEYEKSSKE